MDQVSGSRTTQSDKCPSWCTRQGNEPHEHMAAEVRRGGFGIELLRYYGDDTTLVTVLEAMDGGAAVTMPLAVLVDLMGEIHGKVAAS